MTHFLPPEHVRQVNKLEWPYMLCKEIKEDMTTVVLSPGVQTVIVNEAPRSHLLCEQSVQVQFVPN